MWHTDTVPDGWLMCDGAAIPVAHNKLISLVGTNTPNLIQKSVKPASTPNQQVTNSASLGGQVSVNLQVTLQSRGGDQSINGSTNRTGDHGHTNSYSSNSARFPDAQGHSHGGGGYTHRNVSGGASEVGTNITSVSHGHGIGNTNNSESSGSHDHSLTGSIGSDHSHSVNVSGNASLVGSGTKTAAPTIQTLFIIKHD